MNEKLSDLVVSTGVVLLGFLLAWGWARVVRRGQPLTRRLKEMLAYWVLFMSASAYSMMVATWLAWTHSAMWALIAGWGVLLGAIAWWRHRRARRSAQSR